MNVIAWNTVDLALAVRSQITSQLDAIYSITRKRGGEQISVADIIEAVEGPIALTSCVAEGRHDCSLEGSCKVQPHWGVVNGAVRAALQEISLASLSVAPAKGTGSHVPPDTAAGGSAQTTTAPAFAGATMFYRHASR